MTFDMGRAWSDAMKLVSANKEVLAIIAGVFFFLPSVALSVFAPTTAIEAAAGNPEQMQAVLLEYLGSFALLFIAYLVATLVGTLALYALMGRVHKPTVGEAIKIGFTGFLPYLATSLIVGMAIGICAILIGLLTGLTGSSAVGILLAIVLVAAFVVVSIRLVLVGPVIAVDGVFNPIEAMQKSWNMVKGNTRYIFAFVLLIGIAVLVISLLLGLLFAAVGALFGAAASVWVEAILGGILGAAITIVLLAVYSSIHQQLSGGAAKEDLETFE